MKKNILKAFMVLSALSFATSAFAMKTIDDSNTTVIGGGTFKTSKSVKLTATATASAYSAIAGHGQGDKEFGSNNLDPKIFVKTKSTSTAATNCDSETFDFSTWTTQ
ncbi:MAG: hypothetical protein ED859_13735 [Desulfuromonadales bacterium]|nr:MAG: hypothetical protein ED859_13735 [Desulfuromonadales bacterium]